MNDVKKTLIVRLAEGIGNQLFMYANAYSLSKKYNCKLFIDNTSGYFKKKNKIRTYELNNFYVDENLANSNYKFDTYIKDFKRKFLIKLDKFSHSKKFILESKDTKKKTFYKKINLEGYSNKIFIEGHFESEKYFYEYESDLKNIFKIKTDLLDTDNKYINDLASSDSVSICIRQNRYSEGKLKNDDKSKQFTKDTIDYIFRAIKFIRQKVNNPKFFIWSNEFNNLSEYFNKNDYTYVDNKVNKPLNDFHLFNFSKHFIVGPTSFHWWGAWLNNNPHKICIRPTNINPSNNEDFWPNRWINL